MNRKLRIGVIFGGRSGEHEVSLVSATSVIAALDSSRFEGVPIDIGRDGRWISAARRASFAEGTLPPRRTVRVLPRARADTARTRRAGRPSGRRTIDVVFPLVHGTGGEDGALQGLLELAGIPYVGAGVLGSALGMDKILQKKVFAEEGFPIRLK